MIIKTPIEFNPTCSLSSHKWNILRDLWTLYVNSTNIKTLSFTQEYEGWYIRESIDSQLTFQLRRDPITLNRYTDIDKYGLLGLSLLNLSNNHVFITEGVSDFISAKLCLPSENVLGVTTLGGNFIAKTILISLFEKVTIISDQDSTGLLAATKWKSFFNSHGISSSIWQPSSPTFKDFTDEFLFNLKISNTVQF